MSLCHTKASLSTPIVWTGEENSGIKFSIFRHSAAHNSTANSSAKRARRSWTLYRAQREREKGAATGGKNPPLCAARKCKADQLTEACVCVCCAVKVNVGHEVCASALLLPNQRLPSIQPSFRAHCLRSRAYEVKRAHVDLSLTHSLNNVLEETMGASFHL